MISGKTKIKLTYVLCVPILRENLMLVPSLVRKEKVKDLIIEGAAICENNAKELIVKHTFEDSIHK